MKIYLTALALLFGVSRPLIAGEIPPLKAPVRGTLNAKAADTWEDGLLCGNGTMGAVVLGNPLDETVILSHGRLFMPWEKPLPPVNTGAHLSEIRQWLAEGKYQQAADYVVQLSKQEGYDQKRWTDPFIPAFDLRMEMEPAGTVRTYGRSLDFTTGAAAVRWEDDRGAFLRRLFVSRPDDVVVVSLQGEGPGSVSCRLRLATRPYAAKPGIDADYWNPEGKFKEGIKDVVVAADGHWLTYQSSFRRSWPGGLQGYEGVAGVYAQGGTARAEGSEIIVHGASEILIYLKIGLRADPAKTGVPALRAAIDRIASSGFDALLARHAKVHGEIFGRVRLDLGGGEDHKLTAEELLAKSSVGKLNRALLEKEFDKARYLVLSSSGDWPPALQGIWTGTWGSPWSGDYTQNGNVQAAIASELSGNMAECLLSYFNYMDAMLPDFRESAWRLFGARGIHVPSRMSSHGLNNHFDRTWPMTFWTAGAAWAAHFYYDYWLYTGDRKFLAGRALPFMKEAALFYDDFLFTGKDGKYIFSPSYSPENAPKNSKSQAAVNATMDIALARELVTNLIAACRELGIEKDGVERWTMMLAKMPDYQINADGAVKEWSWPGLDDDYQHRHNSHLVALFDGVPPDISSNPNLLDAFRQALELRMRHRRQQTYREMAFGLVQLGLAATSLRDAQTAYEIVDWLANDYWTPALNSTHEPKKVFNVDIAGGLPAVVIKMLLYSQPGQIDLLPALPKEWPQGKAEGLPCRGQLLIKNLEWNGKTVRAVMRSAKNQSVVLSVPGRIASLEIKQGKARISPANDAAGRRSITLPAGQDVAIEIRFDQ